MSLPAIDLETQVRAFYGDAATAAPARQAAPAAAAAPAGDIDPNDVAAQVAVFYEPEKPPEPVPAATTQTKAPELPAGVDAEVASFYLDAAQQLGVQAGVAQKLLEQVAPTIASRQQAVMRQARDEWAEAARNDAELGGEQFDDNLAVAREALARFGTPALRQLLDASGLGSHPEVVRAFYRAGKGARHPRLA